MTSKQNKCKFCQEPFRAMSIHSDHRMEENHAQIHRSIDGTALYIVQKEIITAYVDIAYCCMCGRKLA